MTGRLRKAPAGQASPCQSSVGNLRKNFRSVAGIRNNPSPLPVQTLLQSPGGEPRGNVVDRPLRIAFIGNALPRRCGIATFTTDLELAVSTVAGVEDAAIIAMCDPGGNYEWPPSVRFAIDQNEPDQYLAAADFINTQGFDVACLQHEFGIYGGDAGNFVLGLIAGLRVPLVTTLHTVLDQPNPAQRAVMKAILAASARVIVMARKGRDILIETYGAEPETIGVIPHGIPDVPFQRSDGAKVRLGFAGRKVILTFGLISPSKGIETMIEAMPAIIARSPHAVYVVMGATHPQLLRADGEAYRDRLIARVKALGIDDHVVFLNRFVDRPELLEHIAMCDVYVSPYLVASQLTSGTLAYSHGLGRPVVSTPYWHAAELLGDGSGILVPFGDSDKMGNAVADLLDDDNARFAMASKAYAASRPTIWTRTGERYVDAFRAATQKEQVRIFDGSDPMSLAPPPPFLLPETSNRHFIAMCDDTGIFQHAIHDIPDRHHGYCVDDNARALLLCCTAGNGLAPEMEEALTSRFAAFVQHAWNPDTRRFRNFMSFSRQWLEPAGSEDSHGRTLWALGACAQLHRDTTRGRWTAKLFREALLPVANFTSPRAWAFTLLGLDHFCSTYPEDHETAAIRVLLVDWLYDLLLAAETPDWVWFEDRLTYDNARLPEALIRTGRASGSHRLVDAGLRSLRWLMAIQTAPSGVFRPVGSTGFMLNRSQPLAFDQQPLEATATIAACAAAHYVDPDAPWQAGARHAFAWFLGKNDLGIRLVDSHTGICRDGLHPDRANENSGAESVLSWLMALADMRALQISEAVTEANLALRPIAASRADPIRALGI